MDDRQALKILSALADGAHPITGEVFAADSPYQSPDIVRALFRAIHLLEGQSKIFTTSIANKNPHVKADQTNADRTDVEQNTQETSRASTNEAQKQNPGKANVGKPWTSEEDAALLAAFDAKKPLSEIAKTHGRTQNGVRARLEKQGRLESTQSRWTHTPSKPVPQVRDALIDR